MSKRGGSYPRVRVEGGRRGVVSQFGAVLLVETARKAGLDAAISEALAPWCKARAVHDPGKFLLNAGHQSQLGGCGCEEAATGRLVSAGVEQTRVDGALREP